MNKNEIYLWSSILLLTVIGFFIPRESIILIFFWVISIFFVGNAKKINIDNNSYIKIWIRRSMYIIPYFIPVFFLPLSSSVFEFRLIYVLIGIFIGLFFILIDYKSWMLILNKDYILLSLEFSQKSPTKFWLILNSYSTLVGSIAEETFFRLSIFIIFGDYVILSVFLSTLLFIIAHFGTKWGNRFSLKDFCIQFGFSLCTSIALVYTQSFLLCIFAHLTFNFFHLLSEYLFYYFGREKKVNGYSNRA